MNPEALHAKRSPLSAGTVLVIGTIVAMLLVWWVLVVGFRAMQVVGVAGDPALVSMPKGVAPDVTWREQIARNPTQVRPYRKLALVLERQGKQEEAAAAIEQALWLDPTHPGALSDAADFYLRNGRAQQALPIFRRAVELYPSLGDEVWPVFAAEFESGRGRDFILRAATENPAWWSAFFRHVCEAGKNIDDLAKVLVVRADAGVLTNAERACLIDRIQRDGRWADARRLWLDTLPAEQRGRASNLFNGNFEWPLSNVGFDWIVQRQDSAIAQIDTARGKRALHVTFANTRYAGAPLHQYLLLDRGRYRLEGSQRADGLDSWLGLQWGLYCRQEGSAAERQLAKTEPLAGSRAWMDFAREFTVPANCTVQVLRLELANPRRDAETPGNVVARLHGSLWYQDLKITALD
jgi:hypothetical protein